MRVRVSYWNTEDEDKDGGRLKKRKPPERAVFHILPQLVVWPLLFLLAAAGIGTVVQAARRLYRLPKK